MNLRLTLLLSFLVSLTPWLSAQASDNKVYQLEKKPAPELKDYPVLKKVFPNGLILYFLENHELPVVKGGIMLELGTIHDPPSQIGLVNFLLKAMRGGGVTGMSSEEVDGVIERNAADIGLEAGPEYSSVRFRCLKESFPTIFPLLGSIMKSPSFEAKQVDLIRRHLSDDIASRNERPMSVAGREFTQLMYGEESVWARLYDEEDVENITREDLILMRDRLVSPNRIRLVITGDLTEEEVLAQVEAVFGAWEPTSAVLPVPSALKKSWESGITLIPKDVTQAAVVAGHFGDKRDNPDKFSIIVANHLLGGMTFGSRLGDRIRAELGLVYSVGSRFDLSTDYGLFKMSGSTKIESTAQVIKEMRGILTKLIEEKKGVREEEVTAAKNVLLNQLIFQYEDAFEIAWARAIYDFHGLPPNYLTLYQKGIKKVSSSSVRRAFQNYFFPDKLGIVVVGPNALEATLKELGSLKIKELDNN